MDNKKFFYLANDTTFKYLFKNEKTRGFFGEILEYYTRLNISDFVFIDNVLINSDKSIIINVEMNREYKDYLSVRNRKYLHRLASNIDAKVIQVNFNCYLNHEDIDISFNTYMLTDIENNLVEESFKIHNIYIPKVVKNNKELVIIMDEVWRLNKDKYFGALYNIEEHKSLEEASKESGRREGFLEGTLGIAKKMLDKKCELEFISDMTGLSIEEINNLKDE